jgi:hypothetical protein
LTVQLLADGERDLARMYIPWASTDPSSPETATMP